VANQEHQDCKEPQENVEQLELKEFEEQKEPEVWPEKLELQE